MTMSNVRLTEAEWEDIQKKLKFLECLERAGVENWDGYDFALEYFHD